MEQKNGKGYSIRLFCISVDDFPDEEQLKELMRYIATQVNAAPDNSTTLFVEEEQLRWIPEVTVWSS